MVEGEKDFELLRASSVIEASLRTRKEFNDIVKTYYREKRSQVPDLLDGEELKDFSRWGLVFLVARLMYNLQDVTMTELRTQLEVERYTITRVVSWMERKGLVERSDDPNDQRVVRVALTDKGRQYYEAIQDLIIESVRSSFSRLTPEEQIIYIRLNEKLAGE